MRKKPFWGNHFWAKGYCVDTVGLNSEMVQKYVKFQEGRVASATVAIGAREAGLLRRAARCPLWGKGKTTFYERGF